MTNKKDHEGSTGKAASKDSLKKAMGSVEPTAQNKPVSPPPKKK